MRKKLLRNQAGRSYSAPVEAKPMASIKFSASAKFPDASGTGVDYKPRRYAGVFDGTSVWMTANLNTYSLLQMNMERGALITYPPVGTEIPSAGGCFDGTYVWIMPYAGKPLTRFDPVTEQVVTYSSENGVNGNSNLPANMSGVDCTYDGRYIWAIAGGAMMRVDPQTGTMTGTGCPAGCGLVLDDEGNLWSGSLSQLVKYNIGTGTYKQYDLPQFNTGVFFPVWDGQNIWCLNPYKSKIYRFNPETETSTLYDIRNGTNVGHYINEINTRPNFCTSAAFDGKYIWLAPKVGGLRLLRIDTANGAIAGYEITNTGYQLDNTDLLILFEDIVYTGNGLVLVPYNVPRVSFVTASSSYNGVYEEYVDEEGNQLRKDSVKWIAPNGSYSGTAPTLEAGYIGYRIDDGDLQAGTAVSLSGINEQHIVTFVYEGENSQPRYPMTEIQTALVLDVDESAKLKALPTPENTTDAIEWESTNEAVVTVTGGVVTGVSEGRAYVAAKNQAGTVRSEICVVVESGDAPVEPGEPVSLTNLLKNPDYSANWTSPNESFSASGGVAAITATQTAGKLVQMAQTGWNLQSDRIYYTRGSFRTTDTSFSSSYMQLGGNTNAVTSSYSSNASGWTVNSAVFDGAGVTGAAFRQIFAWNSAANLSGKQLEFTEPLLVDLTEAFGAGAEPNAEWCHNNIPFFEDTVTIHI